MLSNKWSRYIGAVGLVVRGLLLFCRDSRGAVPAVGPAKVGVVPLAPERVVLTTEPPGRTASCLVAEIRPQVNLIESGLFGEGVRYSCA